MKRTIFTLILLIFAVCLFGQNQIQVKKATITSNLKYKGADVDNIVDTVTYTNDTLFINYIVGDPDTVRLPGITDTSFFTRSGNYIILKTSADSIGLGTTTPEEKLEIAGNLQFDDGATRFIQVGTSSTTQGNHLVIKSGEGTFNVTDASGNIYLYTPNDDTDGNILLNVNESGTKMGGYVGVGVAVPGHPLDVDGNIRSNGEVILTGLSVRDSAQYVLATDGDTTVQVTFPVLNDSLKAAEYASPSVYTPWLRDTTDGQLYQATLTDFTGVQTSDPKSELDVAGESRAYEFKGKDRRHQGLVTFSIDDGTDNDYLNAFPLFTAKGEVGELSVVPDWIGDAGRMTYAQLLEMEAAGWEICSHGMTHTNVTTLNETQKIVEIGDSRDTLMAHGLTINNYSYSSNAYDDTALMVARDYYRSARSSFPTYPINKNVLKQYALRSIVADTPADSNTYKAWVDTAYAVNGWLIFYLHDISDADSAMLAGLINYIQGKGMQIVTRNQGLDLMGNSIDVSDDFAVNGPDMKVTGSIFRDDTATLISTYADATADGYNTFVGYDAGNFKLSPAGGASSLASSNTSLGYITLRSLTTGYRNTAIGSGTGKSITTGYSNTLLGYQSGYSMTLGQQNTAVGRGALFSVTTSDYNTAIGESNNVFSTASNNTSVGYQALLGVSGSSTGTNNVAVGVDAGKLLTTGNQNNMIGVGTAGSVNFSGSYNNLFGYRAGYALTSGDYNIAIGNQALVAGTTGGNNVAIGRSALYSVTTTSNSVAVGASSNTFNTAASNVSVGFESLKGVNGSSTGTGNTAIGTEAGELLTTGTYNLFAGMQAAGSANVAGDYNIGLGYKSLYALTSGDKNISIGTLSGISLTTEGNNVFIGHQAGSSNTGSANVFIGYQAAYNETGSNKLYIENSNSATPLIYGDFASDYVNIVSKLHIGASLASPTQELVVNGNADIADTLYTDHIVYEDTYYKDATVSALSLAGGVNSPTLITAIGGIKAMGFNHQTANDIAYGQVQFNHDMKLGTDIEAHIHYSLVDSPASGSDTVVFVLEYSWADVNELFPTSDTIELKIPTFNAGGGGFHRLYELGTITGNGGDNVSSVLIFRVERLQDSASDTYGNYFLLHDIDFHYEVDSPGSNDEYTK